MASNDLPSNSLTGNSLKIIGALSMLIDHIGHLLLPEYIILRIIGRLALPIFAFMIAEGCRYTKNKLRYFLSILSLGIIFQIAYYRFNGSLHMSIFITFSLSIIIIYALQHLKATFLLNPQSFLKKAIAIYLFSLTVISAFILNKFLVIDYGFWGCMLPVFASVFHPIKTKDKLSTCFDNFDFIPIHVFMLLIGLIILAITYRGTQPYALFAIPLLLLYSGERGKVKMKLFFYIFYPIHLLLLQGIYMLIK